MADLYFDFNRGNDANSGLTRLLPKKNLNSANLNVNIGAGNAILLANDSVWDIPQLASANQYASIFLLNGASYNNKAYITSYDAAGASGTKPTIKFVMTPVSGDWVWDGVKLAWYIQLSYTLSNVYDIWCKVGAVYAQNVNQGNNTNIQTTYNNLTSATLRTWGDSTNNRIYLWGDGCTTAGTNPTQAFGTGSIKLNWTQFFRLFESGKYLTVDGIHVESGGGLLSQQTGGGGIIMPGLEVLNCSSFDTCTVIGSSPQNTSNSSTWIELVAHHNNFHTSSGPQITFGGWGCVADIYRNTFTNSNNCESTGGTIYSTSRGHSGSNNGIKTIRNNVFDGARNGIGNSGFDGSAIYFDANDSNSYAYGNLIKNCFKAIQLNSGRKAVVVGNIAVNCDMLISATDSASIGSSDYTVNNNILYQTTMSRHPHGFQALTANSAATLRSEADTSGSLVNIEFCNNVLIGTNTPGGAAGATVGYPNNWSKITCQNNYITGFSTAIKDYGGADKTTATATMASGDCNFTNPGTYDFSIDASSTLAGAGNRISSTLSGLKWYRDFYGNPFNAAKPSIGACEVVAE